MSKPKPTPTSKLMSGRGEQSYGSTAGTSGGDEFSIGYAEASPFSFDGDKFYRVCDSVSSNIFGIAKHASTLEKTLKSIGSNNDSRELRESTHSIHIQGQATISETATFLKQLKSQVTDPRAPGGKDETMRVTRLTNDFQQAVKRYTDLQKQIVLKMKNVALPISRHTSFSEHDDTEALINSEAQRQHQLQLQQELEFEQGMLIEREDRIRQIETDILTVNDIMKELGMHVHQQGEVIDTIEGNIEQAYTQVDDGREQLQKASSYQSSYRKKLFCLLGTGLIALIIVVVILITTLKN